MPNNYNSNYTGEHNDNYEARIADLESKVATLENKGYFPDFTNPITSLLEVPLTGNGYSTLYTATEDCIMYIEIQIQANSSGGYGVRVNNYDIIKYIPLTAITYSIPTLYIPLKKDDIVTYENYSNYKGHYRVFRLRHF